MQPPQGFAVHELWALVWSQDLPVLLMSGGDKHSPAMPAIRTADKEKETGLPHGSPVWFFWREALLLLAALLAL